MKIIKTISKLFESSIALVALVGIFSISFVSLLSMSPKSGKDNSEDVSVSDDVGEDKINFTLVSNLKENQSFKNLETERKFLFTANLNKLLEKDSVSFQIKMENLSNKIIKLEPVIKSSVSVDLLSASIKNLSNLQSDTSLDPFATEIYEVTVSTSESINYPFEVEISFSY